MYEFLTYCFPVILVAFEFGLRSLVDVDTSGFIGPTLAAAALSNLIPLGQPKRLNVIGQGGPRAVVVSEFDLQFCAFVWLAVFLYFFLWFWTCVHTIRSPTDNLAIWGGLAGYVISLVMAYVKRIT